MNANFQTLLVPFILTLVAGLATTVGGLIFLFIRDFKPSRLVFCLGISAGAMLYISFVELLGMAVGELGFFFANMVFLSGIGLMMLVDFLVPHRYFEERDGVKLRNPRMFKTATLVAIGIAIHNFPEGLAVLLSGFSNIKLGIALAVAIAAHNIPEGIAVATPVYYATGSGRKALLAAFLSGLAEPIGALIGIVLIMRFINPRLIAILYAFIAGIMVLISFDELLPEVFGNKSHRSAIWGLLTGMVMMILSLSFL